MKFLAQYVTGDGKKARPEMQFVLTPETSEERALIGICELTSSLSSEINEEGSLIIGFYND